MFPTALPTILLFIYCLVPSTAQWGDCSDQEGVCIDTDAYQCSSATISNKCLGSASIQCCPAPSGIVSSSCTAAGGLCKKSTNCDGSFIIGLCPGPSSITCCVSAPAPTLRSNTQIIPPLPPAPDTSGNSGSCTTPQDSLQGSCIDTAKCTGGTFNDLCSDGLTTWESDLCCVTETRGAAAVTAARITLSQFQLLFTGISPTRAAPLYPYFISSLTVANINTCNRAAAYIGQIGHESAGLLYFEEIASGVNYEGNLDLGNTQVGDGRRYKGRGPIQLTGRSNYRAAGLALGRNFEDDPELVGMPSGGFEAAAWYWNARVSNTDADLGTQTGYDRITDAINGCSGQISWCNGVPDRNKRWNEAKDVLGCEAARAPVICFSGETTVEHMDKGEIAMNELVIGDTIKVSKDTFERVYSFGHRDETAKGEFVQIYASGLKNPLELSKDHMLFVQNHSVKKSVPASLVQTGDSLVMGSGPVAEVQHTKTVVRRGAYAPFTASGTIVVNGVMASNYVSLQEDSDVLVIGGIKIFSMQWLAYLSQAPHRLVCSLNWSFCQNETYTNSGISKWVYGPHCISTWLLKQNAVVVTAVIVPVFSVLALLALVEAVFMSPALLCLAAIIMLWLITLGSRKKSKTD